MFAALLVLAGCDQVFGFPDSVDAPAPPPPPPPSDGGIDAPMQSIVCTVSLGDRCTAKEVTAEADTYIEQARPTTALGNQDVLLAGTDQAVLLKFDTSNVLGPTDCVARAEVLLQPQDMAIGCGNALCSPCPAVPLEAELHWLTTDWTQSTATWSDRDTGMPWAAPGAQAVPADRSTAVTIGSTETGALDFAADAPELLAADPTPFLGPNRLAAIVVTTMGSGAFGSHRGSSCGASPPPTLVLTVCARE